MWIVDRHFPFKLDRGEVKQLNVSLTGCVGVEGLERSKLQEIRFTSNLRTNSEARGWGGGQKCFNNFSLFKTFKVYGH